MPEPRDPNHWLFRFSAEEWLRAARHELVGCTRALHLGERRSAVAFARRAAGMAVNAVLIDRPDDGWGRSYMDHLRALARDEHVPEEVRLAAGALAVAPLDAPRLIPLGGAPEEGLSRAAEKILIWCEEGPRG